MIFHSVATIITNYLKKMKPTSLLAGATSMV